MPESIYKNNELENEVSLDMSYFWNSDVPTRYPTDYELENYKWLILSSDSMWDPYLDDFAYEEDKFERLNPRMIWSVQSCYQFDEAMLLKYWTVGVQTSIDHCSRITPEQLAWQWCIGLQMAAKTLMSTTQKGLGMLFIQSTDASEQDKHNYATHN